jgi:hypothetical protein
LRVTRIVHPAGAATSLATMGLALLPQPVALHAAQVFDIELQVITDHPIDRVQITDPLPAGIEAVDTSFKTNTAVAPAQSWQIDDQQITIGSKPTPTISAPASTCCTTSLAPSLPARSPGPAAKLT